MKKPLFLLAAFLLCEWNGALKDFAWAKKLWIAFYHAVTPRSCGFPQTRPGSRS